MKYFFSHIIVAIIGIWLATGMPGVVFDGNLSSLALAGFILGIINFIVKPVLNILTFPLKILTFGLFSLFLNVAIIWFVDVLVLGSIFRIHELLLATIIIWVLKIVLIKKK